MRSSAYFTLSLYCWRQEHSSLSLCCGVCLVLSQAASNYTETGARRTHRWLLRAHQICPSCSSGKFGHFDFYARTPPLRLLGRTHQHTLKCLCVTSVVRYFLFQQTRILPIELAIFTAIIFSLCGAMRFLQFQEVFFF